MSSAAISLPSWVAARKNGGIEMAGEWIKFEASTPEKQEVFAITAAMEWDDPDLTVGKLLKVWRWFDQQTIAGNAPNVTFALLDRISGVSGFAQAMCDVGWLVETGDGFMLPHFDRHNGKTAKDRALTAKRVAKHKTNAEGNAEGNAAGVSLPLPREEKRREDLKSKAYVLGDAEDASPASPVGAPPKPDCPHQEIIAVYHEVLPQCPQIRDWTPARAQQLRARWNEDPNRQNIDYWRRFFEYVKGCDFLVGRSGKTPFFADLEWMTKSSNFTKIREEKYANRT